MNINYAHGRIWLPALLAVLMLGCGKSHGQAASDANEDEFSKPSFSPTPKEILAVTAPGYKTPNGMLQECLGRIVFDVPAVAHWPTLLTLKGVAVGGLVFSKHVRPSAAGEMAFGNVNMIKVFGPVDAKLLEIVRVGTPAGKLALLSEHVKDATDQLASIKGQNELVPNAKYQIDRLESRIENLTKSIREIKENYREFDPGLPHSEGFANDTTFGNNEAIIYSVYRAYLYREKYVFVFESTEKLTSTMDRQQHKKQFVAMLSKFRPRKPNEIPTELGVCIPHGFIADDGKTLTEMHQALRFSDAPGVLYRIHTGNVDGRWLKAPLITAIATAGIGKFGTDAEEDAKPFISERIGPRTYPMGGLQGSQGGVAFKVRRPGKEPFEAYTVYTGYSGWLGTDVLPYILTEMSTRTMEQAPELKENPPPFKQSMGRLELLLKSIRLRPTNPLMPDLAKLKNQ